MQHHLVMGGRWRRWIGFICLIVLFSAVTGAQHQDGDIVDLQQLQQHGVQQLDVDAPAQPPTVHLGLPSMHMPAAPSPAPVHRMQRLTAAEPGSSAGPRPKVPLFSVIWMSGMMSLMSCLGVLPYFFVRKLSKPWAGLANAVASGVMLAASFGLLAEGGAYSGSYLIAGMLLGVMFVKFSQTHLEKYEVDSFEQLAGADARKVILFLAVMAVHAVGEGGGVGVSFAGDRGWAQGTLVTLAIGLHNVPEGLAVATVMAARGTHPARTLLWTALTALPQALVAPPAFLFVDTFKALLPLALGFAAGCMIWIVLAELLPDALEVVEAEQVATYATASAAWLQGLSVFISHLETPSGTLASPFAAAGEVVPQGISRVLLQLLPACTIPGLVVAMHTWARCRQPAAVCTAAGTLASYSLVCGMNLLLWSEHGFFCGLLLPVLGVVLAAALWVQWQKSAVAALAGHIPLNNSSDMVSHGLKKDCWLHPATDVTISPAAVHLSAAPCHRSSCANGLVVQDNSSHDQQQQYHRPANPCMSASAVGWDVISTSGSGSNSNWSSQQQLEGPGIRSIWCNNSTVKGSHHSHYMGGLDSERMPLYNNHGVHLVEVNCSSSSFLSGGLCDSRALDVRVVSDRNSRAGCALALVGAAGCGIPVGLQLASALAAAPDSSTHLALPLAMLGVLFGLVYSGLLPQIMQNKPVLVSVTAGTLGTLPLVVAVTLLLVQPYWVQQGLAFALADILQGLLTGFNVAVPLLLLAASGRRWGWKRCSVGTAAGVSGGLLVSLCMTLMCWGTPYCLRWAGSAFIAKTV